MNTGNESGLYITNGYYHVDYKEDVYTLPCDIGIWKPKGININKIKL